MVKETDEAKEKQKNSRIGYKLSEETKQKISNANKGKSIHINTRKAVIESNKKRIANGDRRLWDSRCISIDQYDLNGNYIQTYSSIAEAGRKLNINDANIGKCVHGIYKQCGGYIWKQHIV